MKHETMKILEEWRKEILRSMDGITITRDFQPPEDQTIDLLWFVHSNKNSIKRVKQQHVKGIADDVTSLNKYINIVEQRELKKLYI